MPIVYRLIAGHQLHLIGKEWSTEQAALQQQQEPHLGTARADRPSAMSTRAEKLATHSVFFPFPVQGHVTPALHLAKLLHVRGRVSVTFVHSDSNRRRLLRSRGAGALSTGSQASVLPPSQMACRPPTLTPPKTCRPSAAPRGRGDLSPAFQGPAPRSQRLP